MQIKKERKQTYRYSYTQLAVIKPAKAPGQDSIGTGGQNSIGANKVMPWDDAVAQTYGSLRAQLHITGTPLAPLDLQIASHALHLKTTLVSDDKAFTHVKNLQLENWL